ncbi:hypothetical protein B0H11DRAFT_1959590 [Mycena galericulata]|nr:hypothetical protein B0H11DRAFT_1959590 [Mycena galericulata]
MFPAGRPVSLLHCFQVLLKSLTASQSRQKPMPLVISRASVQAPSVSPFQCSSPQLFRQSRLGLVGGDTGN